MSLPLVSMSGQPGQRAAAELVGELRAALEQPRVQVEDVAGVGLATGRATQQQRDRAVGLGLLGQVVEDDQGVLALVHPVLAQRRAGVRSEVLERGGERRRRADHGRVGHGVGLLEDVDHLADRRALLPDGDVDALDLLRGVAALPVVALVDDRVEGHRRLAGLPVADDQLALAAADGGHGVDRLDAGLQGLLHRLALHDRRRLRLEHASLGGLDLALAVERAPERVDDPAEEAVTDGDREDLAGPAHLLALADVLGVAEDDAADLADVEVERDPEDAVAEVQQLVGHGRVQALDPRDAVTGVDDPADLGLVGLVRLVAGDELLQRVADLLGTDGELRHLWSLLSLVVTGLGVRSVGWWACGSTGHDPAGQRQSVGDAAVEEYVADADGQRRRSGRDRARR